MKIRSSFRGGYKGVRPRSFDQRRSGPGFDPGMIDASMLTPEAILNLGMQAQEFLDRNERRSPYFASPTRRRLRGRGPRKPMGRVSKRRFSGRGGFRAKPMRPRNPYHCFFCNLDTKNKEEHIEHQKTGRHIEVASEREIYLERRLRDLTLQASREGYFAKANNRVGGFCTICCADYEKSLREHKETKLHRSFLFLTHIPCVDCDIVFLDRISFERHLLKLEHIRNRTCKLLENPNYFLPKSMLTVPEKRNEDDPVGEEFLGDVAGLYCKICDELFHHDESSPVAHSKTEKHYEKFKEYVEKRKAGLIKPRTEKEEEKENEATEKEEPIEDWDESGAHEDEEDADDKEGEEGATDDEEVDAEDEEKEEDAEGDEVALEDGDEEGVEGEDEGDDVEGDGDDVEGDGDDVEGDGDDVEEDGDDVEMDGDEDGAEGDEAEGDEGEVEDEAEPDEGMEETQTEEGYEVDQEELDYDLDEDEPEESPAKKGKASTPRRSTRRSK